MLENPRVGQEVIYVSSVRNIYARATVLRADGNTVVRMNDLGTVYFVEIGDEIIHIRGT